MGNTDGSFRYSPVRQVDFYNTAADITVYPNPVTNDILFIASSENCNKAALFDAAGKAVKSFLLQGRTNTLELTGIAKGIYQLKIFTGNVAQTCKIIVQ